MHGNGWFGLEKELDNQVKFQRKQSGSNQEKSQWTGVNPSRK